VRNGRGRGEGEGWEIKRSGEREEGEEKGRKGMGQGGDTPWFLFTPPLT